MKFREIKENPERKLEHLLSEKEKEEKRRNDKSLLKRMNDLLFSDDLELESHS